MCSITLIREGVVCGMRKFEKVYFAEFHLWNVPQITPEIFSVFHIVSHDQRQLPLP